MGGNPAAALVSFPYAAGFAPVAGSIQPTAVAPNEIARSLLEIINVDQSGI